MSLRWKCTARRQHNTTDKSAAGPDSKKRKSPASGKGAASKKKEDSSPGDGEKPASKKPASNKPASKAKNKKAGQLVDPNTGDKVKAAATVESKPAAKPTSSKQVKAEKTDDQAGASTSSAKAEPTSEQDQPVEINRAPVLTLWVAVVAQRQGFSEEAGLTFGKAISGMLAQSKGRSIGVFDKKDKDEGAKQEREEEEHKQGVAKHDVFGMSIKAKDVGDDGDVRALDTSMQAIQHKQVEGYLKRAFKDRLQDAKAALKTLADSYKPEDIGKHCYHLYEQFRPTIASGQKGWGQKGQLDLVKIKGLVEQH
ncbi:hypothetical protein ABBQ38_015281 [Trebouxia sp. C0009 RCD-2024]